jgi:hypothetical protein
MKGAEQPSPRVVDGIQPGEDPPVQPRVVVELGREIAAKKAPGDDDERLVGPRLRVGGRTKTGSARRRRSRRSPRGTGHASLPAHQPRHCQR